MLQNSKSRRVKSFQHQALPIDEDLDDDSSSDDELNFNLSEMTAIKYLKHVRYERINLPEIVTIDEIPEKYRRNQQSELPVSNERIQRDFGQTQEWQENQKERFAQLQAQITNLRNDTELENRILDIIPIDVSESDECIKYCKENEPKLSFMLALDQRQLENLIEHLSIYFDEKVKNNEFNDNELWITKWIYSSLACLRIPLDPEVHNSIRMIAKSCIEVIQSVSNNLPYNLLIIIIANNFHQFDLLSL